MWEQNGLLFSFICREHGHVQLHCWSVLIWNPINGLYFFFLIEVFFLQSGRILYGMYWESSGDVYFPFTQRFKTQCDIVFAANCIFPEFSALQAELDQNPVLTAALPACCIVIYWEYLLAWHLNKATPYRRLQNKKEGSFAMTKLVTLKFIDLNGFLSICMLFPLNSYSISPQFNC